MNHILPPKTQHELLERTRTIAGLTLAELAHRQQQAVPAELLHAKGWVGQLIEQALGASAASRAEPDFTELGIELKTIPLNARGLPKETTYVCTVPLNESATSWQASWIRRKLNHVLWLPIEADPKLPLPQRRIGSACLARLTAQQDQQLKQDWLEHMELITTGRINEINAQHGTYLQVRPKAADHKVLRDTTDENGHVLKTLPRGFYLRTSFTAEILTQNYAR